NDLSSEEIHPKYRENDYQGIDKKFFPHYFPPIFCATLPPIYRPATMLMVFTHSSGPIYFSTRNSEANTTMHTARINFLDLNLPFPFSILYHLYKIFNYDKICIDILDYLG